MKKLGFAIVLLLQIPIQAIALDAVNASSEQTKSPQVDSSGKDIQLMLSPMALLAGILGGQVSAKVMHHWVLSGDGGWVEVVQSTRKSSAWELGVTTSYFFEDAMATGWFMEAGMLKQRVKIDRYTASQVNDHGDSFAFKITPSYGWTWNSGIRAQLGAGIASNFQRGAGQRFLEPLIKLQVGLAFDY